MASRFTVVPDERFEGLRSALADRLAGAANLLTAESFGDFLDPVMQCELAESFRRAGADEGTVWLLDAQKQYLVASYNSGPHAGALVGAFKQPLKSGMISLVLASEQPICENQVYENRQQDKTLDRHLGLVTCAMVAVPFYFVRQLRGVISCVQLRPENSTEPETRRFSMDSLGVIQQLASVISRLIDHRLLALTVGRENS
jgi:hypothetical protein